MSAALWVVGLPMQTIRRGAFWIAWNVPCGRLAPWLFGVGMGAKMKRVKKD